MPCNHCQAERPILGNPASMEIGPVKIFSSKDQPCGPQFLQCNVKKGPDYLTQVSDYVSKHRHETFTLKSPTGATLKMGHLEDTIYSGEDDEVNGWGEMYLPKAVSMQVMGVVEGISCPCDQLVLMTSEDGQLYVFDGEEVQLHLVASSMEQVNEEGLKYPPSKTYNRGDALDDMSDEEWAEMEKRLDKEHHDLVMSKESRFLENLRSTRHSIGVTN